MSESSAFVHHYDLKSLAKSLKLASIDVIKTSKVDIESHWFRSIGPADLYYWKAKDKIVKHQISLFNQVIEWNEYDGVKTGYVNDDGDANKAEVIYFDQSVNDSVVRQAIEFLGEVNSIEQGLVKQFITNYSFYNRWTSRNPMAVLRQLLRRVFRKI